jgi:hypothetical protein
MDTATRPPAEWGDDTWPEDLTAQEYMALRDRCAVCWWPARRPGRWMELHHIVGGPGRKDVRNAANWISLCNRCHRCVHDSVAGHAELPRGAILTAKQWEDGHVDLLSLARLKRRQSLPYDPEPIPEFFLEERRRNGGEPWP